MIEVFKTNVEGPSEAHNLINVLRQNFPERKITIDLHDCDKVLRVEGKDFATETIVRLVKDYGFVCKVLE